jgi:hypothetical protein
MNANEEYKTRALAPLEGCTRHLQCVVTNDREPKVQWPVTLEEWRALVKAVLSSSAQSRRY